MAKQSIYTLILFALVFGLGACNDPSEIGSGLVSDEFSDIEYTDTLSLQMESVEQERITTYLNAGTDVGTYLVGSLDDPLLGHSQSALNMEFIVGSAPAPNFEGATLDSIVLSLQYDGFRTYGDTLAPQTLEVYQLTEPMPEDKSLYYSDFALDYDPVAVGSLEDFMPRPLSRTYTVEYGDSLLFRPTIRLHLDHAVGEEIMSQDSIFYTDLDNIQTVFYGLRLASPEGGKSILAFAPGQAGTYLRLFYTKDGEQKSFTLISPIINSCDKYSEYTHDYAGSPAEAFIDNAEAGDSLVFVQGMSGLHGRIRLPNVADLDAMIINDAELEFTLADIPESDTATYGLPPQLALSYLGTDGDFHLIDDVNISLGLNSFTPFGGSPADKEYDDGTVRTTYRVNISSYLQAILECTDIAGNYIDGCIGPENFRDAEAANTDLYLQIYQKDRSAFRTVFYGPGHSQYPAKLYLTYTRM